MFICFFADFENFSVDFVAVGLREGREGESAVYEVAEEEGGLGVEEGVFEGIVVSLLVVPIVVCVVR